eukprot:8905020-Heterocapsa_arctica.AAC.1
MQLQGWQGEGITLAGKCSSRGGWERVQGRGQGGVAGRGSGPPRLYLGRGEPYYHLYTSSR